MERRHRLKAAGFTLEELAGRVAEIFGMEVEDIGLSGKYARIVPAGGVFCYWAVRELGMRETEAARRLKLARPAVCISVGRGERIAKEKGFDIPGEENFIFFVDVPYLPRWRYGLWGAECLTEGACSVRRSATGERWLRDPTAPVVHSTQQYGLIYGGIFPLPTPSFSH